MTIAAGYIVAGAAAGLGLVTIAIALSTIICKCVDRCISVEPVPVVNVNGYINI